MAHNHDQVLHLVFDLPRCLKGLLNLAAFFFVRFIIFLAASLWFFMCCLQAFAYSASAFFASACCFFSAWVLLSCFNNLHPDRGIHNTNKLNKAVNSIEYLFIWGFMSWFGYCKYCKITDDFIEMCTNAIKTVTINHHNMRSAISLGLPLQRK